MIKDFSKNARKSNVGHIPGSDLTENWWDQVYNKVASKILVKTTKDSVAVHAAETKESSKNKSLLYARFVKGATLKASEGIIVEEPEKSSESESEKEQIPPRLTDEEIFKICGGRTAHKAAGHGLKQNGKLQRIQEQEQQYLESLNKKTDIISNSPISDPKRGKKHKRVTKDREEQDTLMEGMNSQEEEVSRKKRKKESKEELQIKNMTELAESTKIKKKKKKKCKEKREQNKKQEKDKKNCVIEDETSISNKGEKKKKKKEYLEVNKESEEANDVEIIEKKKQYEMKEYEETEQEFKEMTKKKNKHRVKTKQLEKEQEEKGDERKKKSKKKKKKEHKKKKQETEKSLIANEDSHIKIGDLSDKIEGEINENAFKQEPVKVDSCQKKVRFSLELVTVFTISDEENETHVQASKKKKKKHQTFD